MSLNCFPFLSVVLFSFDLNILKTVMTQSFCFPVRMYHSYGSYNCWLWVKGQSSLSSHLHNVLNPTGDDKINNLSWYIEKGYVSIILYLKKYAYLTLMSKYSRGDTTWSAQQDRQIQDAFERTGELI